MAANYFGKTVRFRFGLGTDSGDQYAGWDLDDISIVGAVTMPFAGYAPDTLSCVSISPSAGNGQSTAVGTNFANPLQVRLMGGDGLPIGGATVNFLAPASGASAVFTGGSGNAASAITDVNGYASTPAVSANSIGGNYNVTASFGVRTTSLMLGNVQVGGLIGVVSRKTHGAMGAFDLVIDSVAAITGPVSVESRGIGSGHTVFFQFSTTVNAAGTLAVVDAANATISASAIPSGNDVIVTIPSLADNKRVTITLTGVNGSLNPPPFSIGFLVGDVNNTRSVNASDISAVKARSGQPTTNLNFKFDVNASGAISAADISAVKARSGLTLP